ncbi:hypothetical protein [Candidatus Parabeggiatoa sp. HSG14]|uniref:hypothetical protein n=1 Tax=Candidatus Parabeggiatoa sp. HSG14 TaxID=3055593 RepID=UPI0025A722E7|nr:cytochrome c3 family protein [Thiotrichales bacterium HSG14]
MKLPRIILGKIPLLLLAGFFCFYNTAIQAEDTPWWAKIIGVKSSTEAAPIEPMLVTEDTKNSECIECHGVEGFAVPTGKTGESRKRPLHVDSDIFNATVHGEERCVACHKDIEQMPHKLEVKRSVDCIECHKEQAQKQLRKADADNPVQKAVQKATHYLASVHGQKREDDPSRMNANCWECHGKHNVFPMDDPNAQTYRLSTPRTCGQCHEDQLKEYNQSTHGAAVKRYGKREAAVCSDCHGAHKIASPEEDPVKLAITESCGGCHEEEYESYHETYHGQVTNLGYTHTAKCFDCHKYHDTQKVDDVKSMVHKDNRLETCQTCHEHATAGFVTFEPHGNSHDFERFPQIWIVSKFMIALLAGVFLVFWTHSALWFYREYRERQTGHVHVRLGENGEPAEEECQYVERFTWSWRLAHLVLAIAVMVLVLTGTAVLYSDSFWAPFVMKMLGGAKIAAIIHRVAAVTFAVIFFGHLAAAFYKIFFVLRGKFRWFGPYSLIPNFQDMWDFFAMMKWFFGKGPRPVFDHWAYWEKFDYWAPFWGMFIIGISGLMLWIPNIFAMFLPGWVFNVATIVHGEEAFLAAVFLFTVHFFNCHFRPDKLPQDTIMFTGRMPLSEFKEEREIEYKRLVEEGTLEKYLVGAPSWRMARYSKVLGFILIGVGLTLLFLVLQGFVVHVIL